MKYIREHLGARLFLANLVVIVIGVIALSITTTLTIPVAFNRHMGAIGQGAMGGGMGMGQGNGMMGSLFENFRASVFESLTYATLASVLAALIVSLFVSRRIVAPMHKLSIASQRIAEGHYLERVQIDGEDEIAQLATRFNGMAAQIEQTETMRRQLIGDVSHELRTPLTAIKAYMEGLQDGVLPAGPETFSQIHADAVSALVQTTFKRLSLQAQEKRIGLHPNLPPDLPPVLADEDRVTQVLVNLVGNALQYTPEGGDITISSTRHGNEVHISISDTGIGIPPEHLSQLFTRFYRVDKSRSRASGGGSGIGLTIARHLIEAHGGRIWAESAGEGQGSTFTFSLKLG